MQSRDRATTKKYLARPTKLSKLKPNLFSIDEIRNSRTAVMICANVLRDMRLSWLVLSCGNSQIGAISFVCNFSQQQTRASLVFKQTLLFCCWHRFLPVLLRDVNSVSLAICFSYCVLYTVRLLFAQCWLQIEGRRLNLSSELKEQKSKSRKAAQRKQIQKNRKAKAEKLKSGSRSKGTQKQKQTQTAPE